MSQERWDVVVRFLNGPRQFDADLVMRGPVVRLGSSPGPNGVKLDGYRALDDRHAVISAYQGGTAQIAPVGPNQVRVAPHENVDWGTVQPIRGPVYLSDGCAVHLGPPGRGCTFTFVECRRLGVWQQGAIASEAADANGADAGSSSQVSQLDVGRRIPWWFLPGLAFMVFSTMGAVALMVLVIIKNQPEPLGPIEAGKEVYEYGDVFSVQLDASLQEATGDGFKDFVTAINATASANKADEDPASDPKLLEMTTKSEQLFLRGWAFWAQLERSKDRYAMVLKKLRAQHLPDVLAGVPSQESGYNPTAKDVALCAFGMWQFQPEIAFRNGLAVKGCHNGKTHTEDWAPTERALPINAIQNADYVVGGRCMISSCDIDERGDAERATDAAVANFLPPWKDSTFRASGALVQLMIATHNAGYKDGEFRSNKKRSMTNIGESYPLFLTNNKVARAPDFIGRNILCDNPSQMIASDLEQVNNRCGGYLPSVTQTYVPYVIARHLVAVCYYGTNYATMPEFKEYAAYTRGYCKGIKVPTPEEVRQHTGGK